MHDAVVDRKRRSAGLYLGVHRSHDMVGTHPRMTVPGGVYGSGGAGTGEAARGQPTSVHVIDLQKRTRVTPRSQHALSNQSGRHGPRVATTTVGAVATSAPAEVAEGVAAGATAATGAAAGAAVSGDGDGVAIGAFTGTVTAGEGDGTATGVL